MALTYSDIVDVLLSRAERLGLASEESQQVDAIELEMYLFNALLSLVELNDLDVYTVRNTNIAKTQSGVDNYELPADYGRLILPRSMNHRGMQVDDTVDLHNLEYLDPSQFNAKRADRNGVPTQFTVLRRHIHIYPPPDTNSGNNYTLRGVYIERVGRPDLEDEVLLEYPTALIEETLFKLASDAGRLTQTLATTRNEAMAKLMGGPLGNPTRIGAQLTARGAL